MKYLVLVLALMLAGCDILKSGTERCMPCEIDRHKYVKGGTAEWTENGFVSWRFSGSEFNGWQKVTHCVPCSQAKSVEGVPGPESLIMGGGLLFLSNFK